MRLPVSVFLTETAERHSGVDHGRGLAPFEPTRPPTTGLGAVDLPLAHTGCSKGLLRPAGHSIPGSHQAQSPLRQGARQVRETLEAVEVAVDSGQDQLKVAGWEHLGEQVCALLPVRPDP